MSRFLFWDSGSVFYINVIFGELEEMEYCYVSIILNPCSKSVRSSTASLHSRSQSVQTQCWNEEYAGQCRRFHTLLHRNVSMMSDGYSVLLLIQHKHP